MLELEETLHMTISVKNLPNLDAELQLEEGDSKVDPYYVLKGIDTNENNYTFLKGDEEYVRQTNTGKWTIPLVFLDRTANIVGTAFKENSEESTSTAEKKLESLIIEIWNKNFMSKDTLVGSAEIASICRHLTSAGDRLQHRKQNKAMICAEISSQEQKFYGTDPDKYMGELFVNFEYGDPEMTEAEPLDKKLRASIFDSNSVNSK